MKKIIVSLALCTLLLAGCNDNDSSSSSKANTTDVSTTAITTTVPATTWATPTEQVNLEGGPTDAMMERGIMNEGNLARLAKAMKKAKNDELVTLAFIGGSITQGSAAKSSSLNYVNQISKWWETNLEYADINSVNAGIGATNSYLGVHRAMRDVIDYAPDVVFVEFSVNDTNEHPELFKETYDSLVRMLLNSESQPAVVLIFTTMEDGTSTQDIHKQIGFAYDIPMLSYHDVVYPEVKAGTLLWTDISPDNIHPDDAGHTLLSQIAFKYFEGVLADLDTIDTSDTSFTTEALTSDRFANAYIGNQDSITATANSGFDNTVSFQRFDKGWGTAIAGSSIKFTVDARNLGVIFKKTTDGLTAKAEVWVNGKLVTTIDGDFTGGWGTYAETAEIISGATTESMEVEIKLIGEKANFEILGLLVS